MNASLPLLAWMSCIALCALTPARVTAQDANCNLADSLAGVYYKRIYEAVKRDDMLAAWEGSKYFWMLYRQASSCAKVMKVGIQVNILKLDESISRPMGRDALKSLIGGGDFPACSQGGCSYTIRTGGTAGVAGMEGENYFLKFDLKDKTPSVWMKQEVKTLKIDPGNVLSVDPQKMLVLRDGLQIVPKEDFRAKSYKNYGSSGIGVDK